MSHQDVVDRLYDIFDSSLHETEWDHIYKNVEYFSPYEDDMYYNNPKGEMDIAFYNEDERKVKYVEVKTSTDHVDDGKDQIMRALNHFEELGFDFEGEIIVSPREEEL